MELEAHQQHQRQQELKHVCKFCGKSFACGRSLGGHMRSHMINDISALADGTKLTKKKLPPLATYLLSNSNSDSVNKSKNINSISPGTPGYILRENPKRTWKFSDHHHNSSEDDNNNNTNSPFLDKSCKECGKVFQSWKALFGHMKSHSIEKERVSNNNIEEETHEEQQGSWTTNNNNSSSNNNNNNRNNNQKLVMDSQSDNETAAPSKRKRSKRRTRYKGAANSSSLSFPNNASSVSEIEQEQEEVAMCLVMLSRDVGQLGGFNTLAVESSDNNSVSLGTNPARAKSTEGKNFACKVKVTSLGDKKLDEDSKLGDTKAEFSASGIPRKECTKNDHSEFENSGVEFGKNFKKESGLDEADEVLPDKCNDFSSKRKSIDSFDREMKSDSLKKFKALDAEGSSKFECTTCNKVFHSYHALGGHRASHKKIKGCFASKIDNSENSIETESSPDQQLSDRNKLITPTINEIPTDQLAIDRDEKAETSNGAKKSKGHECPICLKVFPSGQALGGHKRAHLIAGAEAKGNQVVAAQEPIPVIRDFLDLNLPAPVEEESNGPLGFNPWWIASSHKHEPLIGLISN